MCGRQVFLAVNHLVSADRAGEIAQMEHERSVRQCAAGLQGLHLVGHAIARQGPGNRGPRDGKGERARRARQCPGRRAGNRERLLAQRLRPAVKPHHGRLDLGDSLGIDLPGRHEDAPGQLAVSRVVRAIEETRLLPHGKVCRSRRRGRSGGRSDLRTLAGIAAAADPCGQARIHAVHDLGLSRRTRGPDGVVRITVELVADIPRGPVDAHIWELARQAALQALDKALRRTVALGNDHNILPRLAPCDEVRLVASRLHRVAVRASGIRPQDEHRHAVVLGVRLRCREAACPLAGNHVCPHVADGCRHCDAADRAHDREDCRFQFHFFACSFHFALTGPFG